MSLRGRLLVAVGAVALIALGAADVATYSALRSFLYARVDQSLEVAHRPLADALLGFPRPPPGIGALASGVFLQVRDASGHVLAEGAHRRPGRPPLTPQLPPEIAGVTASEALFFTAGPSELGGPPFRVRASAFPDGTQLIVAVPLDETLATLRRLLAIEVAVTVGALVTAALLGWWLVRIGLRPLSEVESTAAAISDGDLDRRVPGDDSPTEVGRLARALNKMLGRIQDAFAARDATEAELRESEERLRRFVADASHELRTPLTAVAGYAELFDRGAGEHPEDLPRVIAGIRSETGRMGALVEDMLLLARLDEGRPLEQRPVDLVAVAGEAVHAARAVGADWHVRLDAERPVEVVGDHIRLRQVIDNLLANVRAHTPKGTSAVVRISERNGDAIIEVSDHGPGLPDNPGRLFERFYRADASRSREHGGAGLGLAIVAGIVKAHGGRVDARAGADGGATFIVRLPGKRDLSQLPSYRG